VTDITIIKWNNSKNWLC